MTSDRAPHYLNGKRIIVAGSGVAGSTFVAAFGQLWLGESRKAPEVLVFDCHSRDDAIHEDSHMLILQGSTSNDGMFAIQQLRRLENVKAGSDLTSAYFSVWDKNGKFVSDIHPTRHPELPASAMRVSREHLMTQLVDKAERVSMAKFHWSCECTNAERLRNGQIRVSVESKDKALRYCDCDILIVADGPNGKLGASLQPPDAQKTYRGSSQIMGISHFGSDRLPAPISALNSGGMQMSDGEDFCCMYTPIGDGAIRWVFSQIGPAQKRTVPIEVFEELKKSLLDRASSLAGPFRRVIEATDPASVCIVPAMERLPFSHSHPEVIFLGDSYHLCSMLNPKGADLALKDGWDLAEQLYQSSSLRAAVTAYDQLSIPRVQAVMNFTKIRVRFGHSTGGLWQLYKNGMRVQRLLNLVGSQYQH
ncbi:putative monooxygenase [Trichoderma velutinum]